MGLLQRDHRSMCNREGLCEKIAGLKTPGMTE
jgi:hypothetical protein